MLKHALQRATFAALRCFYVARSYLAANKAVEAMGLFQRTTKRIAQADQAWDDLEHPDPQALKDLEALKEQAVVSLPTICSPSSTDQLCCNRGPNANIIVALLEAVSVPACV